MIEAEARRIPFDHVNLSKSCNNIYTSCILHHFRIHVYTVITAMATHVKTLASPCTETTRRQSSGHLQLGLEEIDFLLGDIVLHVKVSKILSVRQCMKMLTENNRIFLEESLSHNQHNPHRLTSSGIQFTDELASDFLTSSLINSLIQLSKHQQDAVIHSAKGREWATCFSLLGIMEIATVQSQCVQSFVFGTSNISLNFDNHSPAQ